MCYYIDISPTKEELKKNFNLDFEGKEYDSSEILNGFSHPWVPVIKDENPTVITTANWGLIPVWAKDRNIQKKTLNAKIETIKEKASFKNNFNNRCLVLVRGFYEWKWLDSKGNTKQKHYLTVKNQEVFSLGGIYSHWTDEKTGEELTTFSIVTTQANELMTEIHNIKHRMPIVLYKAKEMEWLQNREIIDFAFPTHESDLIALNLDEGNQPLTLF